MVALEAARHAVRISGWACVNDTPPCKARWFAAELTRDQCVDRASRLPGLRGRFGPAWPRGDKGTLVLEGVTDNRGNTFVASKRMTSKFPLVIGLTELFAQLRTHEMGLHLSWVPRDQNEEADALLNGSFGAFDLAKRVPAVIEDLR